MRNAKLIAISAIASAFATVFLTFGNWFTTFSLSGAFTASLCMMLPIAKKSYKGAVLAYLSTVVLTGVFSGFFTRWEALLPFAVFSGLHPTVNYFLEERKVNKILAVVLKDIWFVGTLLLTQLLTKIYVGENEFINKYIYPILIIAGALVFPLYDHLMGIFQRSVITIIKRLNL